MSTPSKQTCFMFSRCRTGSTTLLRAISENKYAAAFPEIMNGIQEHCYQSYLVKELKENEKAQNMFRNDGPLYCLSDYLYSLIDIARNQNDAVSFIVFECKLENMYSLGDQWSHPSLEFNNIGLVKRLADIVDTAILLRRKNVWQRFCSDISTRATGIYHSDQGDPAVVPFTKIKVPVQELVRSLSNEIDFDEQFYQYLVGKYKKVWRIYYEDIFAGNQFSDVFVQKFAERFNGIELIKPPLDKIVRPAGHDLIDNYDEVITAMKNAPALSWMLNAGSAPSRAAIGGR